MANRFQKNQHELAYNFIAARDGNYCLACVASSNDVKAAIIKARSNGHRPLQIDHKAILSNGCQYPISERNFTPGINFHFWTGVLIIYL